MHVNKFLLSSNANLNIELIRFAHRSWRENLQKHNSFNVYEYFGALSYYTKNLTVGANGIFHFIITCLLGLLHENCGNYGT